jgi:hypothetical protein
MSMGSNVLRKSDRLEGAVCPLQTSPEDIFSQMKRVDV